MARDKVFISYSHADDRWRQKLVEHLAVLAVEGRIHLWDDSHIGVGGNWRAQIEEQLDEARVALLLVSAPFLASDFVRSKEIPTILERHEQGGLFVYPLLVRPCSWQLVGWLAKLQIRPRGAKALASHKGAKIDEVLADVSREIATIVGVQAGEADGISDDGDAKTVVPAPSASEAPWDRGPRHLKVRVHRAYFRGQSEECYFINLTNLSPGRALEVTHVWYEDEGHHIPVEHRARELPTRLEVDQSWETWIVATVLPQTHRESAFGMFRARTSDGTVFVSERNENVPPIGSVPGGQIRPT